MCLQQDLRCNGLNPDNLDRVSNRTMPENVSALTAGETDVIQIFQPYVEQILSQNLGHIWYSQANRGYCTYTTLYATKEMIAQRPEELYRMTRAMYRCQKWLHKVSGADIASAVSEFFPQVNIDILSLAAKRYIELGVWGKDPHLPREGFERLRNSLFSGGLIKMNPEFEDCVENKFADAVINENPPPA